MEDQILDFDETPKEPNATDKSNGSLCHLLSLVGFFIPFGNIIGPLIIWQTKKKESEFVDYHGKESLNFQIAIMIYTIILVVITVPFLVWSFIDLGENPDQEPTGIILAMAAVFIPLIIFSIIILVLTIIAAVKSNKGEYYRYPFIFRLIK